MANVDLGKSGPLVVDVPPGAIVGMIDDFWERSLTDVGLPGPDSPKGGKFLLIPRLYRRGSNDRLPHCSSNDEQQQHHGPRHRPERRPGRCRGDRQELEVYPLSEAANPKPNKFTTMSGRDANTLPPKGIEFWERLSTVINNNPVQRGGPDGSPSSTRAGSNGPFRGELGDAIEGSVSTVGMIKCPGKITPRVSDEMFWVHDWWPTLASIIGGKVPTHRPMDGMDQSVFIVGRQPKSNRESVISFIGDEVVAVRWRNYRIYPKQFIAALEKYPNPKPVNMTQFGR